MTQRAILALFEANHQLNGKFFAEDALQLSNGAFGALGGGVDHEEVEQIAF